MNRVITVGRREYEIKEGAKVSWTREGDNWRVTFNDISLLLKDVGKAYYIVLAEENRPRGQ